VSAVHPRLGHRSVLLTAIIAAVLCCQSGCVATKYKMAKKNTPPVQLINIAFPASPPLQSALATLISYGGPGSWKRGKRLPKSPLSTTGLVERYA
jgi:hypothetical protein